MHPPIVRTTSILFAASTLLGFALAHSSGAPTLASTEAVSAAAGTPASLYFGDIDGDGFDDALAIDSRGAVTLLSNRGEGRFEDVTLASGLAALEGASCALFADFDGDGDVDLFVGSSETRLWRNLGNASFAAAESGVDHDLVDLSASAVDHDQDGQLDLHVHTEVGDLLYRNFGLLAFERVELPGSDHAAGVLTLPADEADEADGAEGSANGSPSRRRLQRWLRARARTSAPGITLDELDPSQPGGPQTMVGTRCPLQLKDTPTGNCLSASTTPTLGMLYPLSVNLSVSATGSVGMGTTTPLGNLDVVRPSAHVRIGASGNNETSTLSLLESNSDTSGFDVRYQGSNNQFQIAARDGTATPNPKLTIDRGSGNVGIGTTTPGQKLDVLGNALVSGSVTGSTLASTVATGTAPLAVASTTKVTSLNADLLDGFDSTAFTQLGNSIESGEISDGTIANADLAASSVTSANIVNGTIAMADLGQNGAFTGQVIKWNGSAWAPATDTIGSGSQYLTLGPGSYRSDDSNLRCVNSLFDGVWATGGTWVVAPVHLPAGAQVLSVKAYVNDTQGGANLNVAMLWKDNASPNSYYVGSPTINFEVLAGTSGFFNQTFPASNAYISGNSSYYVLVYPTGTGWPGNGTLAVQNIAIEWRMP